MRATEINFPSKFSFGNFASKLSQKLNCTECSTVRGSLVKCIWEARIVWGSTGGAPGWANLCRLCCSATKPFTAKLFIPGPFEAIIYLAGTPLRFPPIVLVLANFCFKIILNCHIHHSTVSMVRNVIKMLFQQCYDISLKKLLFQRRNPLRPPASHQGPLHHLGYEK